MLCGLKFNDANKDKLNSYLDFGCKLIKTMAT